MFSSLGPKGNSHKSHKANQHQHQHQQQQNLLFQYQRDPQDTDPDAEDEQDMARWARQLESQLKASDAEGGSHYVHRQVRQLNLLMVEQNAILKQLVRNSNHAWWQAWFVLIFLILVFTMFTLVMLRLDQRTSYLNDDLKLANQILSSTNGMLNQIVQAGTIQTLIDWLNTALPRVQTALLIARDWLLELDQANSTTVFSQFLQNAASLITDTNSIFQDLQAVIAARNQIT